MSLQWIREAPSYWDQDKERVVGELPPGTLELPRFELGSILPGEWWRLSQSGRTIGYGWMDVVWGEGEILLAVDPIARRLGAGSLILDLLEKEAAARGLAYLYNMVPAGHPQRGSLIHWLNRRGFSLSSDEERMVRHVRQALRLAA